MTSKPKDAIIPSGLIPDTIGPNEGLESNELSFRQAFRVLRKRRRLIILTVGIVLGLIILISIVLPARYATTATIELKQDNSDPLSGELGEAATALTGGQSDLKTDLATATSVLQDQSIGVEVLEKMHFADRVLQKGLPFWHHDVAVDLARKQPLLNDALGREFLLNGFESHLAILNIQDTRLLQVTFNDTDPKFAADTTNAIVQQYIKDTLNRRNIMTAEASEWMTNQLDDLRKKVESAQQDLVDFQKKSGFIVVPSGGTPTSGGQPGSSPSASSAATLHSPLLDRLFTLNETLVQAQANRITAEAVYHVAKTQDPDAIAALAPSMSSGPGASSTANLFSGLLALRAQEISLKQQLASTAQTYGAKNPHVAEIQDQIGYINTEIKKENARILNTAESNLDMARASEAEIQKDVNGMIKQTDAINDSAVRLAVLQQEADSSRSLYEDLYTKLEEAKLAQETAASNVSVISEALASSKPQFPNWPLNIGLGIGVGLFLGVIATFVVESLNDAIVSSAQVEGLTHIAVLGIIPEIKPTLTGSRGGINPDLALQAAGFDKMKGIATFEAVESLRTLRTSILLSRPGNAPRSVVMASALPAEGKSTTTFNLAISFASMGTRVLIVDGDMRKPTLHKIVGSKNAKGLSTILSSSEDVSAAIIEVPGVENLSLLSAGPTPPNPSELLASSRFSELLLQLENAYDIVLIDSPPAMLVSDAAIMSARAKGVIIILRAGTSTRTAMVRVADRFQRGQSNIIGFVLNRVNTKSSEYYYEYGHYSRNYYGEETHDNTIS